MDNINFDEQLLKLSNNSLDRSVNEEIYEKLEYFYSVNDRHEYSQISQIVFNQVDDEQNELMDLNLDEIIEIAQANNSQYIRNFKKLKDHLNLCIIQKKFIEVHLSSIKSDHNSAISQIEKSIFQASASISEAELTIQSIESLSESQSEKLSELEEKSQKITTDFVSILGIFSSVIFAAFGGLEILKNILGNIEKVQTGKLMVFSSITIGGIIFLIFLLLNGLSKLTGLKLRSCNCDPNDCNCNIAQKHPSIVTIYFILFFIFILGLTEYILDYPKLINDIIETWKSWVKLLLVFLLSLLFIISSTIWFKKKREA